MAVPVPQALDFPSDGVLNRTIASVTQQTPLPVELNAEIFEKICFGEGVSDNKHTQFITLVEEKLNQSLSTQTALLPNELVYGYSCWYLLFNNEDLLQSYSQKVYNIVEPLLTMKPFGTFKHDAKLKAFVKMCLSFYIDDAHIFCKLQEVGKRTLAQLSVPLQHQWDQICEAKDETLDLQFDPNTHNNRHPHAIELLTKQSPMIMQQKLLGVEFKQWWPKVQWIYKDDDKEEIVKKLRVMDNKNRYDKYNVLSIMLRANAMIVNVAFQKVMKEMFEWNSKEMNIECDDKDYGYKEAPVKTRARVRIKCFEDYRNEYGEPNDYCMVWDWIRCALICKDTEEMVQMYKLIVNNVNNAYFVKKIVRVKNGFFKGSQSNYGYRAILINIVFGNMIAEIQLILLSYLKIRKQMHLYYKIVRSGDGDSLARDFSKWNDR
eukprot:995094_1